MGSYPNMDTLEQIFQWNKRQLEVGELSSSYLVNPRDKHSLEYLKTNLTRILLMFWKYVHRLLQVAQSLPGDAFSILLPENFCKITWKDFMTWRLNNCKANEGHMSPSVYRDILNQTTILILNIY